MSAEIQLLLYRMESEIRPLIRTSTSDNGYDCCGCSTYDAILDHAIAIVRAALTPLGDGTHGTP